MTPSAWAVLAMFLLAAAIAGVRWAVGKIKAGPGPDSRLERLLRDISDEEAASLLRPADQQQHEGSAP